MESPSNQIDELISNESGDDIDANIDANEINKDELTDDRENNIPPEDVEIKNNHDTTNDVDEAAVIESSEDPLEIPIDNSEVFDEDLLGIHADTDDEATEADNSGTGVCIPEDSTKAIAQDLSLEAPEPGSTIYVPLADDATPEEKRHRLARNNMISLVQFRRDQNADRCLKSLTVSPVPVDQLLSLPFSDIMRNCYRFNLKGENTNLNQMGAGTLQLMFHTVQSRDEAEQSLIEWKGDDETKTIVKSDSISDAKPQINTGILHAANSGESIENEELQNLVFIKNIPEDAVESKLLEMLPGAFHIIFGYKHDSSRRNYAFLVYTSKEEAIAAVTTFNESPSQYIEGTDVIVAHYGEFAYEEPATAPLADAVRQKLMYKFIDLKKLHNQLLTEKDVEFDKIQSITLQVEVVTISMKKDADLRTSAGLPPMNVSHSFNRRGGRGQGDFRGNYRNNGQQNNRGMQNRGNSYNSRGGYTNNRGGFQQHRGQNYNQTGYNPNYHQTQTYYGNQQQNYYSNQGNNRGYQNNQGMNRGQKRRGPNNNNSFRGKRGRY